MLRLSEHRFEPCARIVSQDSGQLVNIRAVNDVESAGDDSRDEAPPSRNSHYAEITVRLIRPLAIEFQH